jgi:hypothetical protein
LTDYRDERLAKTLTLVRRVRDDALSIVKNTKLLEDAAYCLDYKHVDPEETSELESILEELGKVEKRVLEVRVSAARKMR